MMFGDHERTCFSFPSVPIFSPRPDIFNAVFVYFISDINPRRVYYRHCILQGVFLFKWPYHTILHVIEQFSYVLRYSC